MKRLLFITGGTVVNGLVFSSTNFVFGRLTDHGEGECKRHDLALKRLQRARDECNKNWKKQLDFINKRLCEKNEARHTSRMLMKQCLNSIKHLQEK